MGQHPFQSIPSASWDTMAHLDLGLHKQPWTMDRPTSVDVSWVFYHRGSFTVNDLLASCHHLKHRLVYFSSAKSFNHTAITDPQKKLNGSAPKVTFQLNESSVINYIHYNKAFIYEMEVWISVS